MTVSSPKTFSELRQVNASFGRCQGRSALGVSRAPVQGSRTCGVFTCGSSTPRKEISHAATLSRACIAVPRRRLRPRRVFGTSSAPARADASMCPWLDASKTPDQRARMLLAQMTVDDKIQMVHGRRADLHVLRRRRAHPRQRALCIPELVLNDAGQGVGDGQTGTTAFPAPIAQAASWDRRSSAQFGDALGWEAVAQGHQRQARPGREHRPRPAQRPQLRVLRRGPVPRRPDRRRGDQGHPEPARHRDGQALRAEQPGDQPHDGLLRRRRADDARDLPAGVRGGGQAGPRRLGHVLLQPHQRRSTPARTRRCSTTSSRSEFGFDGFVMSDWGAHALDRRRRATPASTWR